MENINLIKEFFLKLTCTRCNNHFDSDSVEIMRNEGGYIVARITCPACCKNIGMAMLGVEKKQEQCAASSEDTPISYDDVIDAHKFFRNLDDGWSQFLSKD